MTTPNTAEQNFKLANDIKFSEACLNAWDKKPPMRKNPFQTIGDRIVLIEELEKEGFLIVRAEDYHQSKLSEQAVEITYPDLSNLTPEGKLSVATEFMDMQAKHALGMFKQLGLKEFMCSTLIDGEDRYQYDFRKQNQNSEASKQALPSDEIINQEANKMYSKDDEWKEYKAFINGAQFAKNYSRIQSPSQNKE